MINEYSAESFGKICGVKEKLYVFQRNTVVSGRICLKNPHPKRIGFLLEQLHAKSIMQDQTWRILFTVQPEDGKTMKE
jgi:hypothetical protein